RTGASWKYSGPARRLTTAPVTTTAARAIRSRAGVVTPATVRRKTPNAAAMRPVMCSAFVRETDDSSDATVIAATSASHGAVKRVRHAGREVDAISASAHTPNDSSKAASRVLIDCDGRRSRGRVASNGVTNDNSTTPAKAALAPTAGVASPTMCADTHAAVPRSLPRVR